jgi:hypothetical protein
MTATRLESRQLSAVRAALLALVPMFLLAACGPIATETGSRGALATDSPRPSTSQDPSASVPAGFPVMPTSAAVIPVPAEPQLVARWMTAANGARVYDFFVDALPAAGFQIHTLAPGGDAAIIRFSAGGAPQLELSLTAQGDGTRIDLRLPDAAGD